MTQITINDGTSTITMPKVKKVKVGGEILNKEITMASGKTVLETIGVRTIITAEWDYVPAATMASLITMLRTGGIFTVGYPDPDGTDHSGLFRISIPTTGIFKFVSNVAMWHGMVLTFSAQEVS